MAGIVALGVGALALLNQSTIASQEGIATDLASDNTNLTDLIAVVQNTGVDNYKIKRDWGSYTGPSQPYHFGPALTASVQPTSVEQIESLYIGGINQTTITATNMIKTFDPYHLPTSDAVVAMTPAGVGEADQYQVQKNDPIELFHGNGRFATDMDIYKYQ